MTATPTTTNSNLLTRVQYRRDRKRAARQRLAFRVGPGAVAATVLVGSGGLSGASSVAAGTSPLTSSVVSMVDFSATATSTLDTHVAQNVAPSLSKNLNASLADTSDVAATVPDQAADALSDVAGLADSTGAAVTESVTPPEVEEEPAPRRDETQTSASRSGSRTTSDPSVSEPSTSETAESQSELSESESSESESSESESSEPEASTSSSGAYVAPITGASTSSGYGMRWGRMHNGMDFSAPIGHAITAVGSGTITNGYSGNGRGIYVELMLDDGTQVSYGHMSKSLVANGQRVQAGDTIGLVGNTGRSTGPHMHFEVRLPGGERINPSPWLAERGLL